MFVFFSTFLQSKQTKFNDVFFFCFIGHSFFFPFFLVSRRELFFLRVRVGEKTKEIRRKKERRKRKKRRLGTFSSFIGSFSPHFCSLFLQNYKVLDVFFLFSSSTPLIIALVLKTLKLSKPLNL